MNDRGLEKFYPTRKTGIGCQNLITTCNKYNKSRKGNIPTELPKTSHLILLPTPLHR